MSKQDRQGVRNAADLERKYNFGLITEKGSEEYNRQMEQLNRINQSFAQFVAYATGRFEELERNTRTWFYSGVPTLENLPAKEWDTDELKEKHIGDMYYNEDDGHLYLFKVTVNEDERTYKWVECFGATK